MTADATSSLINQFAVVAKAPDGVARLRRLILYLAVSGQLVPQSPDDEPATKTVEQFKAEKKQLVDIGVNRREKLTKPVGHVPYNLPDGWVWVRLSDCTHDLGQKTPDREFSYIDISAINSLSGSLPDKFTILQPHEAPSRARKLVSRGTLIYSTVRPYLLNIAIIDRDIIPEPIVSTGFAVLHPYTGLFNKFLYYYLRSSPFIEFVESQMLGMAYPAINDSNLKQGLIPLPPLAEQHRIVEKVDQLMALCDELDARQQQERNARTKFRKASLDALISASDVDMAVRKWENFTGRFAELFDAPEEVSELRQAIFQLAVKGELGTQDAKDEPASVLLERIRKEKERLIADRSTKREKPIEPVNQIQYRLPEGWVWIRLGELIESMANGIYKPSIVYADSGIACLRMYNIDKGKINFKNLKRMKLLPDEYAPYLLREDDLLVNRVNSRELVGKAAVIDNINEPMIFESKNIRVRFLLNYINPTFASIYFQTQEARRVFEGDAKQTCGQASISQPQISSLIFPLPPFAEQHRIVEKVNRLINLCDELESLLRNKRENATMFADAIVKNVIA